jgi:hypothetical protein
MAAAPEDRRTHTSGPPARRRGGAAPQRGTGRRGQPSAELPPSGARAVVVRAGQLLLLGLIVLPLGLLLCGLLFGVVGLVIAFG